MGLFDFFKTNKNPDTVKDTEKENSKQLCSNLLQVQNRQEQGIEDNIKVLALRIYQHYFHRARIQICKCDGFCRP